MLFQRIARETSRRRAGLALLAVASFGLCAAPLLHAEQHAREAEDGDTDALVKRLRERGADFDEAFARLWNQRKGGPVHTHSHGPAGQKSGEHGSGSLQHFALAVHGPLPPPAALVVPPPPQPTEAGPSIEVPALRRHTPERAQAPPRA